MTENQNHLAIRRRLLFWGGTLYLLWWFVVEATQPSAINPLGSRLAIGASVFGLWGLSFVKGWPWKNTRCLFLAMTVLITSHFFYLFYINGGSSGWIIGAYITIVAIDLFILTNSSMIFYTCFVLALALVMDILLPAVRSTVFLPGLITTQLLANIGLRSRLNLIKSLKQSNERFQLLFHSSFESILVHENGIILTANQSTYKALGYTPKELIGRSVLSIMHPEVRDVGAQKLRQAEVEPYETRALSKDGRIIDIEVRAKNFIYDERPARLVTVLDISERKKAERDRIAAMILVENLRLRDEFISIASHELKTPISALKLQAQMFERDVKKNQTLPERAPEILSMFNRQINRLSELVDSLLDVTRAAAGRLSLETHEFDLAALIRETVKDFSLQNSDAKEIQLNVPDTLMIHADEKRLAQVLVNLLTNALKYGDQKPIELRAWTDANEVCLMIRDGGRGISPEFLPRIFDRFERESTASSIGGLGLGLYITRQLVEAHGGHIAVTSRPGEGAEFTVRLPRRPN